MFPKIIGFINGGAGIGTQVKGCYKIHNSTGRGGGGSRNSSI